MIFSLHDTIIVPSVPRSSLIASRLHQAKAEKMSQVFGLKFKIRNPKFETIPKYNCSKSKTIKDAGEGNPSCWF
jgi:hypothetical protein